MVGFSWATGQADICTAEACEFGILRRTVPPCLVEASLPDMLRWKSDKWAQLHAKEHVAYVLLDVACKYERDVR